MRTNYLTMDKDDLVRSGIRGNRLNLSLFLSSKGYDICQIVLIVIYCILMIVTFLVEDIIYEDQSCDGADSVENDDLGSRQTVIFQLLVFLEIVILLFFSLDILLHVIGYGLIFL